MTRNISASAITRLVEQLCIEACCVLAGDINNKLKSCLQTETSPLGKEILGTLIENAVLPGKEQPLQPERRRFCTRANVH